MPLEDWPASLTLGTQVEIEAAGRSLRAVVTANDGMDRLRAPLDLFGRSTAVTVDLPAKVMTVGRFQVSASFNGGTFGIALSIRNLARPVAFDASFLRSAMTS